jgi:hypothetical protein
MVESIPRIQQLMAESRFVEAQNEAEVQLNLIQGSETTELIEIYFLTLEAQDKPLPGELLLKLIESSLPDKIQNAKNWIWRIDQTKNLNKRRVLLIKMSIAESFGQTEDLYKLISEFQIDCYETNYPVQNATVERISKKYFNLDFHLALQRLAITLLRLDLGEAENILKNLIISCYEKTTSRGKAERLRTIADVLSGAERLYHLDLYRTLCVLLANGKRENKDLKKLIEVIIFFEDFKIQAIILNYLEESELLDISTAYANEVRKNKEFSFVYFEKFFPRLKQYFIKGKKNKESVREVEEKIDLELTEEIPKLVFENIENEITEEELILVNVLKYNNYSSNELLELAISFLQAEYYRAGLKAADLAYTFAEDDKMKLKSGYLQINCLLRIGDNRAVLDRAIEALKIAETQNDVLSFLYCQAEALIKLNDVIAAKSVLLKILSIDQNYRLAKERLERLNAI